LRKGMYTAATAYRWRTHHTISIHTATRVQ